MIVFFLLFIPLAFSSSTQPCYSLLWSEDLGCGGVTCYFCIGFSCGLFSCKQYNCPPYKWGVLYRYENPQCDDIDCFCRKGKCGAECDSDGDCEDDGNPLTLEYCDLSKCECKVANIECASDEDCQEEYGPCYECENPGTANAKCVPVADGTPCGEVTINCNSYCKDDTTWCYYSKDTASCTKTCKDGVCQSCTPDCGTSTCESCCEGSECSSNKPCSVCSGKKECPGVKKCTTYHFKCTGGACDLVFSGGCIYGILSDACEYDPDDCKCSKECGAECESNEDCPNGACDLETCTCIGCSDSDNGNKPKIAGTCTDANGSYVLLQNQLLHVLRYLLILKCQCSPQLGKVQF